MATLSTASSARRHEPAPDSESPTASTRSPPAVIQGALENIAVEMGYKLMRMSYSSIIRESEDFGAALVDAEGRGARRIGAVDAAAVGARSRATCAAS